MVTIFWTSHNQINNWFTIINRVRYLCQKSLSSKICMQRWFKRSTIRGMYLWRESWFSLRPSWSIFSAPSVSTREERTWRASVDGAEKAQIRWSVLIVCRRSRMWRDDEQTPLPRCGGLVAAAALTSVVATLRPPSQHPGVPFSLSRRLYINYTPPVVATSNDP